MILVSPCSARSATAPPASYAAAASHITAALTRCCRWCCVTWSWPTTYPSPGCGPGTPRRGWMRSMESDTDEIRALKFWARVMLLALVVDLILLAVDHKLKNDVIKESRALRELIGREQQMRRDVVADVLGRTASPADQADRGGADLGADGVVPVADGAGTPPPGVADEGTADTAPVDGHGSPPHRGGVHGR